MSQQSILDMLYVLDSVVGAGDGDDDQNHYSLSLPRGDDIPAWEDGRFINTSYSSPEFCERFRDV